VFWDYQGDQVNLAQTGLQGKMGIWESQEETEEMAGRVRKERRVKQVQY
jgi:hypothetical protein